MTGPESGEQAGMVIGVRASGALVGNVGDTVPLVRYDSAGRRTVIGVATVTGATVNDDGTVSLTVDASTTARDLVEKGMPKAAPEFSIGRPRGGASQWADPDGGVHIAWPGEWRA